jgi:large subunit ribosomal protein L18
MIDPRKKMKRRAARNRSRLKKLAGGTPRLSVFRSNKYIYAQIIDDTKGTTLAQASSMEKGAKIKVASNAEAAIAVGKLVAERAKKAGIKEVVFDRGGYIYHGRVKALAEAARDGGLKF